MVPLEEAPANFVPAAAVIRGWRALLGFTGCKGQAGEVGKCGLSLTGGLPVLDAFYSALIKASEGADTTRIRNDPTFETGMSFMAKGMNRTGKAIEERTRFSFYLAFGIQPDQQILWEQYYKSIDLTYSPADPVIETSRSFITSLALPQCFQVY